MANKEFKFDFNRVSVLVIGDSSAKITPVFEAGRDVAYNRASSMQVGSWKKYLKEKAIKENTSTLTNLVGVYAYIRSLEDKQQYADCTIWTPVRDGVRPLEFVTPPFNGVINGYSGLVQSILGILPMYLESYTLSPDASVYMFVE